LLESVVKKNRARLIPFMLALYVLAFLDRSNIGFAKETYQLDTGLSNEAYALGAGIFFVVYAFLGVPANLLMRKFGARKWIGCTTCCGAAVGGDGVGGYGSEISAGTHPAGRGGGGLFPGHDLPHFPVVSPAKPRQHYGAVLYGRAAGADSVRLYPARCWRCMGLWAIPAGSGCLSLKGCWPSPRGAFTFFWLDDSPQHARFLSAAEKQALIGELAAKRRKRSPRACPMRCVTGGSGSWR
jgi:MFS family permease